MNSKNRLIEVEDHSEFDSDCDSSISRHDSESDVLGVIGSTPKGNESSGVPHIIEEEEKKPKISDKSIVTF